MTNLYDSIAMIRESQIWIVLQHQGKCVRSMVAVNNLATCEMDNTLAIFFVSCDVISDIEICV